MTESVDAVSATPSASETIVVAQNPGTAPQRAAGEPEIAEQALQMTRKDHGLIVRSRPSLVTIVRKGSMPRESNWTCPFSPPSTNPDPSSVVTSFT